MRLIICLLIGLMMLSGLLMAQTPVVVVNGDVRVRHGMDESWRPVAVGDVLKPDDSMKSGKHSSATLTVDGGKRIRIPEEVIIDVSDIRMLSQEELLLKLAMEDVRAIPGSVRDGNDFRIPRTTTVHGSEIGGSSHQDTLTGRTAGLMELNGAKVLYEAGYYATSVLRIRSVFRRVPSLGHRTDMRLLVASAFEQLKLRGEARSEYLGLAKEVLSPAERALVERKIAELKTEG